MAATQKVTVEVEVTLAAACPVLGLGSGYCDGTGRLGARAMAVGHKAKLPDALMAPACIDHAGPLAARPALC